MIYSGGFFGAADKQAMAQIRHSTAEQLQSWQGQFRDQRLVPMLLRYRARNFPESLNEEEQQQWREYRAEKLYRQEGEEGAGVSLQQFDKDLAEILDSPLDESQKALMSELRRYKKELLQSVL